MKNTSTRPGPERLTAAPRSATKRLAACLFLLLVILPLPAQAGYGDEVSRAQSGATILRHPGDPLLVWFRTGDDRTGADYARADHARAELRDSTGKVLATSTPFFRKDGQPFREAGALFALPFDMIPGDYSVVLVDSGTGSTGGAGSGGSTGIPSVFVIVRVEAKTFFSEDIPLDTANTALRTVPDPRKDAEWLAIKAIYDRINPESVFMEGAFGLPAGPARRTSFFGDRRRYLYQGGGVDTTIHTGIDFALAPGTAVLAPARGKVVFAEKRIVTGLTLVLEHLPGMYSVYMHLSAFSVKPGMQVRRGDPIAKSGNTGLSTGPHLHWEIRVAGQPVDPDFFVTHPVPDTLSP